MKLAHQINLYSIIKMINEQLEREEQDTRKYTLITYG
jgi:hypothetical protein